MTGEGRVVATFPLNNTNDSYKKNTVKYKQNANHFMLVSRESGKNFSTEITSFQEIGGDNDYVRAFAVEDDSEQTRFILKTV